jgi:hypothetical protein
MEVAVMSLSTREQQALDGIANRLAGADPKLARLLAAFTRLNSGEGMPDREEVRIRAGWTGRLGRRVRRLLAAYAGLGHAVALLWVLLAVGLIALAVGLNGGGGSGRACVGSWPSACAAPPPAHPSNPLLSSAG